MLIVLLLVAGCNVPFLGNNPVVARVGTRSLHNSDIIQFIGESANPQERERFIANWVDQQLWDIEAKKHVRISNAKRRQLGEYRSTLRVREYKQEHILNKIMISENSVLKYYDEHEGEFTTNKKAAFIELYVCADKGAANDVLSDLKRSETPAIPSQLKLVYKGSCIKPIDEKIFSKKASDHLCTIIHSGIYYVVSVLEKYPENSLLRVEHVRKDIIQKLRMTEYSNVLQQKQKELKDRINVKIIKISDN